ncbi:MAG TPA: VOC family protein [Aggregatilineaceae bacterium]|nr:VOC family protein [Aggregatilineaceae bacterium]
MESQPTLSTNHSMPTSVVIPELAYPDVRQAVDWLCHTFGFVERLRIGNHRAQLTLGTGAIIVTQSAESSDSRRLPNPHAIMVRVAHVDKHYENAKQHGAPIVSPPTDYPYGERQYTADDLGGHRWTFSQTIADVHPADWGGLLLE